MSVEDLFSAAANLSADERLWLSDMLRESVPPQDWPSLSEEWLSEISRRSAVYDAGDMPVSTWDEVRTRTRKQAGLDG